MALVGRSPLSPLSRKGSSEQKKGEMGKHLRLSSLWFNLGFVAAIASEFRMDTKLKGGGRGLIS